MSHHQLLYIFELPHLQLLYIFELVLYMHMYYILINTLSMGLVLGTKEDGTERSSFGGSLVQSDSSAFVLGSEFSCYSWWLQPPRWLGAAWGC